MKFQLFQLFENEETLISSFDLSFLHSFPITQHIALEVKRNDAYNEGSHCHDLYLECFPRGHAGPLLTVVVKVVREDPSGSGSAQVNDCCEV